MDQNSLRLSASPIQFGTDGWRGVLGVDITLERLLVVAAAAARELASRSPADLESRTVVIGYDRRFLAPELAEAIASAVRGCDLEPLLTATSVPTPACSWAVVEHQALGALVITASHNPPEWLGLKIKGYWGGSVEGDFTKSVEQRIAAGGVTMPIEAVTKRFDARKEHLEGLRRKIDIPSLVRGLESMDLRVIVDPMHGSAAGCISELLKEGRKGLVKEINIARDPLFGGNPPEPLEPYLKQLIQEIKTSNMQGQNALGLVFDGDGDRIAAIDEKGRFCSTQLLMPLLIDHLARVKNLPGCVIKTVSGSDLMSLVAEDLGLEVLEMPVGFKYIAAEMFSKAVLVGGEESGGIGFGEHLPERDALFACLLLLESLTHKQRLLGESVDALQAKFGVSHYERIDLRLKDFDARKRLQEFLESTPPSSVAGQAVQEVITTDGVKLRLDVMHWLMFRFSGTEPLLRIYCEAPTYDKVDKTLLWAKELTERV